ncbi:MAG TPA: dihydroneopterin aldolase, partial [Solirubrobacteraceae bacterium]|nr:dihydroneopterin aldolase [Solirubrobacteraceae bacterium]
LLIDLTLEVGDAAATETDLVEDTVDYGEVCNLVALVAQQRTYHTLERLCTAIADRLLDDFGVEAVSVKAAKPEPPIPLPVEEVAVTVWREV